MSYGVRHILTVRAMLQAAVLRLMKRGTEG